MPLTIEDIRSPDGLILVHLVYFFTINLIETRGPFCRKLCNVDLYLQHCPIIGEAKPAMPNDFEMIKSVRANQVDQAIFFRIILKLFRKIACGFSSPDKHSQDVDANEPIDLFGPLELV